MNKLNFVAPVGRTGYGVTGYNMLKELTDRDWEIGLFARSQTDRVGNEKMLIDLASSKGLYFDYDAPCLNLWHQFDLSMRVGRGKYLGWPIFELDTFDERERHNLGYPDELIVCSEWARSVVKDQVDRDSHVVPLGVDPSVFNTRMVKDRQSENTVFINVGKWEIRKGHDLLVNAFNEAFDVNDNVELWLFPHNSFLEKLDQKNWEDMYYDSALGKAGKIQIFGWRKNHADLAKYMATADCGVFPSRAEGWNLEALEMMALGKPLIITDYSAHTEFCNEHNSFLIDMNDTEPAYDGKWFFEQGDWGYFGDTQQEQLIAHMKKVHELVQRPGRFVNDAGIETAAEFTWANAAAKLEKILLDK